MRASLAARLALAFAGLVTLTALVASVFAIVSTDQEVRADVDRFLRQRSDEILGGERQGPRDRRGKDDRRNDEDDGAVVIELSEALASDADAEVQTLDANGEITASNGVVLPVNDSDLRLADRDGDCKLRTVRIDGDEYRMITCHIPGGGALQVAQSFDDTTNLLGLLRDRLLLAGGVLALLGAAAGWVLARRALRPLGELSAAAEQVAATQQLDTPIAGVERDDEIGRLATSFDEMLSALAISREQQHRLVQDAAHELRTPLTSINANIDLLSHAPDLPPEERREVLAGAQAELRQLGTLLTEIVELATDDRDPADHELIDLAEVAQRSIDRAQARWSNPIDATLAPSPVRGDPHALERAIGNLLANAVKYGPPDAPIDVGVAQGRVVVSDRGPGIPPVDRERIFDRFYRSDTARAEPGSGLGLAIVAKVVADHGGQTHVGDRPDGPGASVGFTLPAV